LDPGPGNLIQNGQKPTLLSGAHPGVLFGCHDMPLCTAGTQLQGWWNIKCCHCRSLVRVVWNRQF